MDKVLDSYKEEIARLKQELENVSQTNFFSKQASVDLHLSIDELPIGIYKSLPNGKIVYANRKLIEIAGCDSLEDMCSFSASDFYVLPELRYVQHTQFISNDMVIDEYRFLRKDKSVIWVRDISKKVVDINGVEYYEGTIEDITARKKADEKIRENEEKYRNLVETMEHGLALHQIVLDEDSNPIDYVFLEVNSSFEKLTGLKKEEIIGKNVLEVLPNTEKFWIDKYGKVAITGENVQFTNYSQEIGKCFDVIAYCPQKNFFAVLLMDVTEKVLIENALRESEIKLRTLINSVPDIICFKDGNGRWLEANEHILDLFGLEEIDYIGKTDEDIAALSYDYAQILFSQLESDRLAWNSKKPLRIDEYIRLNNSKEVIFDIIKVPIFDKEGDRKGLVIIGRDITDKKQLEIALLKSENLYKTLINTSPDCITVANKMGRLTYISPKAIDLYHLKNTAEAIGKFVFEFIAPSEINKAKKLMREIMRTDSNLSDEFILLRTDGTEFIGEVSSAVLKDENGKPSGMISVTRDITERKKAEAALRESEFNYRAISELITDYVYLAKQYPSGNIEVEWILGGFEKMTGLELGDLKSLSERFRSIIHPDDYDYYLDKHLLDLNELKQITVEYRIYSKDNNIVWISDTIKPFVRPDEPDILYQIGAVSNITERKKYEHALLDSSKQLKISNDQKDRFFSIIAHDLKSPLSSFLGLTKMFAEQLGEMTLSEIQDYTSTMLKSAGNILELLENLLEWSKMKRGKKAFSPENVSLNYIIDYNVDMISNAYLQKNVTLTAQNYQNITIHADVQMINTILRNLLSNALKFTQRGGSVHIAAEENDNEILVFVRDNGIGMNQETQDKLFDIGHKVSRPGTEEEPSSGLGLLLCKEFVDIHNGKILMDTQVGVGTTFYFSLPKH